jgi:hypothetical protein
MFDCRGCLIRRVERDGDKCSHCSARWMRDIPASTYFKKERRLRRKRCNRGCGKVALKGMAWCGRCAIASNERLLGKNPADDARIHQFISYIKTKMSVKTHR